MISITMWAILHTSPNSKCMAACNLQDFKICLIPCRGADTSWACCNVSSVVARVSSTTRTSTCRVRATHVLRADTARARGRVCRRGRGMRRFALARGWCTCRSQGGAERVGPKRQSGGHMGRDRSPGRSCPSGPIRRRPAHGSARTRLTPKTDARGRGRTCAAAGRASPSPHGVSRTPAPTCPVVTRYAPACYAKRGADRSPWVARLSPRRSCHGATRSGRAPR
jgi:hypothetical protein